MKKLRTFAVSMIVAALGLLIYCAGFYIKSYEQNLAAKQEYAELSRMAGVKNRADAGLLADAPKNAVFYNESPLGFQFIFDNNILICDILTQLSYCQFIVSFLTGRILFLI